MIQRVQVDVAQQRRDHRALGRALRRALFRHPFLGVFQHALAEKRLDQFQDAAIGHLTGHAGQQTVFRDRVEVTLQVGVNDVDVARLEPFIHAAEGVLTPHARPEPVALSGEVPLVDRFQHHAQRRPHHPVLDGRYSQWALLLASRLRDEVPPDRLRMARAHPQTLTRALQVRVQIARVSFNAHVIHPGRATIGLHQGEGRPWRGEGGVERG